MEPVNVNLRGDGREWNLIAGEKSNKNQNFQRVRRGTLITWGYFRLRQTVVPQALPILSVVSTNISTSSLS